MADKVENGRFNPSLNCYSWWTTLYYDDITHQEVVHNAYILRFFEHAREHMLHEQWLADTIRLEQKMFVAVSTEQKHSYTQRVKQFTKVGNDINVRTTVEVDGKYRIRFVHEMFLFSSPSDDLNNGVSICKGHVDMVCVNPTTHAITTLPATINSQVTISQVSAKPNLVKIEQPLPSPLTFESFLWKVSSFDTDFTKVTYQAKYLQYYETCRENNLFSILNHYKISAVERHGLELQVFKANVKFKLPAVFGQVYEVVISNVHLDGKMKMIFYQEIRTQSTGQVINEATVEIICIHSESRKLHSFPFLE